MRKLALLPVLAVALVACADQPGLVAPDGISLDLQPTSAGVWFVTDPPEPALVGDTYDVEARSQNFGFWFDVTSLTPYVCSIVVTDTDWMSFWRGTVTFWQAGECGLYATDFYDDAYQIFEVYEPNETPAPIMKTCVNTTREGLEIRIPIDRPCPTGWK